MTKLVSAICRVLCTVLYICNSVTYRGTKTFGHLWSLHSEFCELCDFSFIQEKKEKVLSPIPLCRSWPHQCWCCCVYVTDVDVTVAGTGVWKKFQCGCCLSVSWNRRINGLYLKLHKHMSQMPFLLLNHFTDAKTYLQWLSVFWRFPPCWWEVLQCHWLQFVPS